MRLQRSQHGSYSLVYAHVLGVKGVGVAAPSFESVGQRAGAHALPMPMHERRPATGRDNGKHGQVPSLLMSEIER